MRPVKKMHGGGLLFQDLNEAFEFWFWLTDQGIDAHRPRVGEVKVDGWSEADYLTHYDAWCLTLTRRLG